MPRQALSGVPGTKSHAGLWLSCFSEIVPQRDEDRPKNRDEDRPKKRSEAFQAASTCAAATTQGSGRGIYGQAFARWRAMHASLGSVFKPVSTQGRLIIGLGIETPLETGLRLHHTYGVPLIPGSAIKGVCAYYAQAIWGLDDPEFQVGGSAYQFLFGSEDAAGMVTFDDAWIDPASVSSSLQADVMTPHQVDYYQEKQGPDGKRLPPSDTGDPLPISFLSVKGKFWLAMRCEGDDRELAGRWHKLVEDLALAALQDEGIGGKTRAGYGRLVKAT